MKISMGRQYWPFLLVFLLLGCTLGDDMKGIKVFSVHSDLNVAQDDWAGDFTGYPATADDSIAYELQYAYTHLPVPFAAQKGIMLSGNNKGEDGLFMFIKNKVTGLQPNRDYSLVFEVNLISNASPEQDGVNGSPGANVFLKAGASPTEPKKIVSNNYCGFNLDKGSQESLPGSDMIVLGNIAAGTSDQYQMITRSSTSYNAPLVVRSNSNGELWLFVGTDSAYKGKTTVYYSSIDVILTLPE